MDKITGLEHITDPKIMKLLIKLEIIRVEKDFSYMELANEIGIQPQLLWNIRAQRQKGIQKKTYRKMKEYVEKNKQYIKENNGSTKI
jgi:predicted nuclease of predicted toxin-antitoxin system